MEGHHYVREETHGGDLFRWVLGSCRIRGELGCDEGISESEGGAAAAGTGQGAGASGRASVLLRHQRGR